MEDVTDCLKVIYQGFDVPIYMTNLLATPNIHFDGLSVNLMNATPDGTVPLMRATIIPEIGDYTSNFAVDDEQEMVFKENDTWPFRLIDK